MSASALSFVGDTDFLANVFDALPMAALVVDSDLRIIEFNLAAARFLERVPFDAIRPAASQMFDSRGPERRTVAVESDRLLVTAAPIPDEFEPLMLLIVEDANLFRSPASSSPGSRDRGKARVHKTDNS